MTRRKESQRRRREQRKQRPALEAPHAHESSARRAIAGRTISWTGLAGGVLGVLLLGQAAVYNFISDDGETVAGVTLGGMALVYLPAIWASMVDTLGRQLVLRSVLALTLVFVVAGVVLLDAAIAVLLIVPSTLLAIAAGLVFQGRRS